MFYIGFTSGERTDSEGWRHAVGELTLGDVSEGFESDLLMWAMADYERQWREGVARLAAHMSSALITSYRGPATSPHSMWPLWREGGAVYIRERIVLDRDIAGNDVAEQFYALVGQRRTTSDDGSQISEWTIPLGQMLAFVADE